MHRPEETELQVGLAAPDRLAPSRFAVRLTAPQRRRSDTRIAFGGEVSFQSLRHLRSDGTSMNSLVPLPKSRKQQCRLLAHRINVRFGSKVNIRFVIQSLDRREREQDGNSISKKILRHIVNCETKPHDALTALREGAMITIPELASEALGSHLAAHMGRRFGSTDAGLIELVQSAARLALDCIGNSDALYHNVEHTMLVTLVGYDILKGRRLLKET